MDIKYVDIHTVLPYEFNNRTHAESQVDRIARSIKEYGFNQPIVIDEDNIILVGHGRLLAAQKLGLNKVPVLVKSGLSEVDKKAYRILDNKLQNDSTWDFNNLELELGYLEDNNFELSEWGLDDLKSLFPEEELDVHEDEGPGELPEETYIKRGDLIELGKHRVLCGDSTSEGALSALIIDKSLSLMVTDPPYGVTYVGKTNNALTIENDDLDDEALDTLWRAVLDLWVSKLQEGGSVYVAAPPGPRHLVFANALKDAGIYRQQLIWAKNTMVLGHSNYHYKHEPIFYGWKPGAKCKFTDDRTKTSLLEYDKPSANREHPTMKPIELWAELIRNSSSKADIVCDPFLGSGTTVIAADQLNRVCYGMEIEPKYCQVIIERYKRHCEKVNKPFECKINGEAFNG